MYQNVPIRWNRLKEANVPIRWNRGSIHLINNVVAVTVVKEIATSRFGSRMVVTPTRIAIGHLVKEIATRRFRSRIAVYSNQYRRIL
jgi:hypothetical protein